MRRPHNMNYSLQPDALKQIEAKMRQMQATGTVVTPDMMEAMYSAALKTGTELNKLQAQETITGMREAAETARREKEYERAKDDKMMEGIGGTIGKMGLRYGTKYLDEKLFPKTTPGGSVTGGGGTTIGGQPIELSSGLKTIGGQNMTIGGQPSLMPAGNPLAGYGNAIDMQALELAPAPSALPGPVTTPPVTPGPLVGPTVETGGAILPSTELAVTQGAQGLAATAPIAELGAGTAVEGANLTAGAGLTETGVSTLGSLAGPAGFGAMGSGILGATGVRDDVGKAILFGQGGETEQDIAGGVVGGAASGAAAGTMIFPAVGTVIGGIIGGVVGGASAALEGSCIIVTCCHGRHSEQVQIARDYRDAFMTPRQIRGYYVLAEKVVPIMAQHKTAKNVISSQLVTRLINYGRWSTGKAMAFPSITDALVSTAFLGLCSALGACVRKYIRANGEVY